MSLTGRRLGVYHVLEPLGVGGMGEVYRARDTKLGRDVAVKVLPGSYAHDTARVTRLQREARLLATLNHPNIAAIHGLEEGDGSRGHAACVVARRQNAVLLGREWRLGVYQQYSDQ